MSNLAKTVRGAGLNVEEGRIQPTSCSLGISEVKHFVLQMYKKGFINKVLFNQSQFKLTSTATHLWQVFSPTTPQKSKLPVFYQFLQLDYGFVLNIFV